MAFTVFQACGGRCGIPRGRLSISGLGMGRFNKADLAAVGIVDRATILVDREGQSLALRAPLDGEAGQTVGTEDGGPCRRVWLAGALRFVGLKPADLHGWHECSVVEDRLEIRWAERGRDAKRGSGKRK